MTRRTLWLVVLSLGLAAGLPATPAAAAEEIPVEGRVLLPWGEPLAEAEAQLWPSSTPLAFGRAVVEATPGEPVARTRTDAEGRFRLSAPHAGLWTVRVEASGFAPVERDLLPLLEPLELPDARMATDTGLTVTVLSPAGVPQAGARVLVRPERPRFMFGEEPAWHVPVRHGETAADGKVVLPRGENERIEVSASHRSSMLGERRGLNGTAARIELASGRARRIEVRAADGTPIAGVLVAVGERPHPLGTTDPAGRFDLVVDLARPIDLSLLAADGRRLETRLAATSWEDDAPSKLVLPERLAVSGRLIDADSRRAIAGGVVWDSRSPVEGFVTDASGGFVLTGPAGARLEIRGGAPGYLGDRPIEFQLAGDGRPGPTLALAPAAAIEGQIADADGRPIAGATVELEIQRAPSGEMRIEIGAPKLSPRARSGPAGKFRLSPVDPDHGYRVKVRADGFAPGDAPVTGLEPRRTKSGVVVRLDRGRSVRGTVVDPKALALREVEVRLTPQRSRAGMGMIHMEAPDSSPIEYGATSDADGTFRIDGVAPGKFDLEASRSGFARARVAGVEVGDEGADVGTIALEPGHRVQGVVSDRKGVPLEGVQVFVSTGAPQMAMMMPGPGASEGPEPDAVTDPTGWFTVNDLSAADPCSFRFERTGFVEASAKAIRLPRLEPLEVRMDPASDVSGTVLTAGGDAIADAVVSLRRSKTIEMGQAVFQTIMMMNETSDADGRFRFEDQEPGAVSLSAVASGYQEAELGNIEVPKGEDVTGIELTLPAGAIVEGRVLLPDGRPAIGAEVRKVAVGESEMVHFGGQPTDGNGYYRLEGLAAGPVSIEAVHESWPRVVRDLEIAEGINTLDLRLEGGVEVAGMVTAADGEPVADAEVSLAPAGRQYWGGPKARTSSDGTFSMPGVPDGDYQLFVEAHGLAPASGEQRVAVAGEPVYGLEVRMDAGGSIAGKVTGIDPERLGSLSVRAEGAAHSAWSTSPVDPRGNYRIEHLRPGTYGVVAELADSGRKAKAQVVLDPGVEEVRTDLKFDRGMQLSGRAVAGDEPVVGAMVIVEGIDIDRSGWGETGEQGGFVVPGLEAGRYRIKLRDWQTGLAHDEILDLATSREIVLEVPGGSLGGRLRDGADRQPLAGVAVTLVPENDELEGRLPSHTATTDLAGRFVIPNLADGRWRLSAVKQGYAAISQGVSIKSGRAPQDLDLEMEPTEGMTLETRLPSGAVPDEIRVAVIDTAGAALVSGVYATGEGGRVRLSTVPAGTWAVVVSAAGSATANLQARAPGAAIPIALQPATGLRVKVPALEASELVAQVQVQDASGVPFRSLEWSGRPVSDYRMYGGKIEFGSLPAGQWSVTVAAADGRTWTGQSQTSGGATSELVLE